MIRNVFAMGIMAIVLLVSGAVDAQERFNERLWLLGRVIGNAKAEVITLRLVSLSGGTYEIETSSNKHGWYAFSDMGQGNPNNYKMVVFKGKKMLKEVSLGSAKKSGRGPDVNISFNE